MRHFINYLPSSYAKMQAWAENYKAEIREFGALIGLNSEEIDAHEAVAAKIVATINAVEKGKKDLANTLAQQKFLHSRELKLHTIADDFIVAYKLITYQPSTPHLNTPHSTGIYW